MQLATLTVLASTFTVVVFVLALSLNLRRILASWGDGVQVTAYLNDDASSEVIQRLKFYFAKSEEFREVTYIPREKATENFRKQMASYAPDLLADADFSSPFPASFRIILKKGVATETDVAGLEETAATIKKLEGIEDVSYGQSWIHNYSFFVSTLYASSGVMALILILGSLFVIGNSIRSSIASRREEIQILELVGATSSMIRRPFVVEGLAMGAFASITAWTLNLLAYSWGKSVMSQSMVLARLVPTLSFLDFSSVFLLILLGAGVGGIGAWISVQGINDGWSARQGLE
jgi:cell division transport system permease protein